MLTFLGDTARYVDYLDTIQPFSSADLSAFCQQTNLAWVVIHRANKTTMGLGSSSAGGRTPPDMTIKTYTLDATSSPATLSSGSRPRASIPSSTRSTCSKPCGACRACPVSRTSASRGRTATEQGRETRVVLLGARRMATRCT